MMNPMSMGKAAGQAMGAMTSIAGGIIGGGKRRREQREAQKEHDIAKAKFQKLDTSNLAANLQNTMEDLPVNTQAADMAMQGQQQAIANTMGSMAGAAGGSGIAALAQAMAGQQSQNIQSASADIARQEQANQMAAAREAASIQSQKVAGAGTARDLQSTLVSEQLSMAGQRKQAADDARAKATEDIMSGVGQMGQAAATAMDPTAGLMGSDRKLKKNIKLIGYSPNGLKIYIFEYINKSFGDGIFQGVMSDEIPQAAVVKHSDGYDRVDYSKLDVEFKKVQL